MIITIQLKTKQTFFPVDIHFTFSAGGQHASILRNQLVTKDLVSGSNVEVKSEPLSMIGGAPGHHDEVPSSESQVSVTEFISSDLLPPLSHGKSIFKRNSMDLECCSKAKLYNFDLFCWCQKNSFYLITRHQILYRFILEYIRWCLFTTKAKLKRKVSKKNSAYLWSI